MQEPSKRAAYDQLTDEERTAVHELYAAIEHHRLVLAVLQNRVHAYMSGARMRKMRAERAELEASLREAPSVKPRRAHRGSVRPLQ